MNTDYIHLHVHTQYSILDGTIRIPDLLDKCKEYGMDSVAITDHGAMYGALDFYVKAKKAGIKPIIGCEFYMAPGKRTNIVKGHFHIVLLAMDYTGYKNLMKMAGIAQFEGFYHKPRIDMETLATHNEGIIALTACLHGQIPWLIGHNDLKGARKKAEELLDIFGDRLYFELQESGTPEQTLTNIGMKQLAAELGIKTVATNDCHYLNKDDAYAHDVLLCIQSNSTLSDPKRFKFASDEFYFKSPTEMKECFRHTPEAIAATVEIAARCNLEIKFGDYHFPIFPVPERETQESLFASACWNGLEERFTAMRKAGIFNATVEEQYKKRLAHEIDTINTMGFPGCFLIVADYVNWAKSQGIQVDDKSGSGGGSLAAYCMQITNIDPITHDLLFERFLNIQRNSMPDFDLEFFKERCGEVIEYIRHKYGSTQVAQILKYDIMRARKAIRKVGRAMDVHCEEVDKIAKLIPKGLKMTIRKAIAKEPRLQETADKNPKIDELLHVAQSLEGLPWQTSTHATSIVISSRPVVEFQPTCRGDEGGTLTQYDLKHTEMTGLIKFEIGT
jgi:DNA polymerase-3 subunit alpha